MAQRRPDYIIPEEDSKLITWLDRRRKDAEGRRNDIQMRINLAFMLGHQWLLWDPGRKRLRRPEINEDDPRDPLYISINKLGGIVERTVSKLTKSSPIPEARPVSDEDDDLSAAKVATRILDHEMHRLDWEDRLGRLYFWVMPLGCSYLHPSWDPDAGPTVGEFEGEDLAEGEITLEIVPSFELILDPNARLHEEARWCIRTVTMTREAVWETYGKDVPDAEEGQTLADDVYALSNAQMDHQHRTGPGRDFVMVHQYWLRPGSRARPEGLVVTWAGKTFLEEPRPFPFDHGELPFVPFDLLPGQGVPQGRTWVTDLIGMQRDYNDARSREAMIRRIMTPKLVGPAGSIDPHRLTSKVEWVPYNPIGERPSWMMPSANWMVSHEEAMNRSDAEMGDRAGMADVSRGEAPAGAPAAAILALQEADDTKLAVSARLLAKGTAATGRQVISLVRQYWAEERLVRTWSEEGIIEVSRFSGANVDRELDVHVSSESALPRSKAARAQLATELWQQQIITDPRYYLRLLNLPGTDFITEQINVDVKHAAREHDLLVQGQDVEVAPWHNHQAHIATHENELRKTPDYEKSPPEIRAVIDAHITVHYQALQPQVTGGVRPQPQGGQASENGGTAPGGGGGSRLMDVLTGQPSNPLQRASGQSPAAADLASRAGIGGPGQPGQVPGVNIDELASRIGE